MIDLIPVAHLDPQGPGGRGQSAQRVLHRLGAQPRGRQAIHQRKTGDGEVDRHETLLTTHNSPTPTLTHSDMRRLTHLPTPTRTNELFHHLPRHI